MIITDHFIFLHMLRTGGTFFRKCLRQNGARFQKFDDKHRAYSQLSEKDHKRHESKPVIVTVRNPWDWTLSLWAFENQIIPGEHAWANGPFSAVVRGELGTENRMASCQDYFEHFTAGVPVEKLHVARFERLREDLLEILDIVGCRNLDKVKHAVSQWEPIHGSTHGHYSEYYDDALRDYVAERNARYIERFDYRFERS